MERSKVFLTLDKVGSLYGGQTPDKDDKLPLFVLDMQHLVVSAVDYALSSYKPRWCRLLRPNKLEKVLVIVVEGVSSLECSQRANSLPFLHAYFSSMAVSLVNPAQYGLTAFQELLRMPYSRSQQKKHTYHKGRPLPSNTAKSVISIDKMEPATTPDVRPTVIAEEDMHVEEDEGEEGGMISAEQLMLHPEQMIQEGYPMPLDSEKLKDFVYTCQTYTAVSNKSPLFSIDCEMCYTCVGQYEMTRISIVNEKCEMIYDTLVKPYNVIRDYVTRFSGMTKAKLQNVATRLEDVHREVQRLIPSNAILCGQSLAGDLRAMKMFHPYVIDTSVIYNLTGDRHRKPALRKLMEHFFGKTIQNSVDGHCSIEDAAAAMDLVKLKLQNGQAFGDATMGATPRMKAKPTEIVTRKRPHSDAKTDANKDAKTDAKPHLPQFEDASPCSDQPSNHVELRLLDGGSKMATDDEVARRRVFYQRPGVNAYTSVFAFAKRCKKPMMLVDRALPDMTHPGNFCAVETDKEATKVTRTALESNYAVCTRLHRYTEGVGTDGEESEDDRKQKLLLKLDKRIRKMVTSLPANSLASILLTGHSACGVYYNAVCLTRVT